MSRWDIESSESIQGRFCMGIYANGVSEVRSGEIGDKEHPKMVRSHQEDEE